MEDQHPQPLPPPPPPPPPPSSSQSDDEITIFHPNTNNNNNNACHLQSTSSSSPQLQSQSSTVVHIPLDQVDRVLSPNNTPDQNSNHSSRRHRSCLSTTCSRIFLILIACILLFAIIAGILYLYLNPKSPTFFIESLSLKLYSSSQNHSVNYYNLVTYNLSMEANNPNGHMGFYYLEGGRASISYKKEEIARGTPPEFYNGKKEIRVFYLVFNSSSETLSKVFAETVMRNDDKRHLKEKIPLVVFIRVPVKIKLGKLKLWKMKMKITCDVSITLSLSVTNVDLGPQHCKHTIQ